MSTIFLRAQYVPFVLAWAMALRLIRRHLKDCPHTSTRYRRCKCPIHVYGTLAGERIRKALDQTSWDAASELINGVDGSPARSAWSRPRPHHPRGGGEVPHRLRGPASGLGGHAEVPSPARGPIHPLGRAEGSPQPQQVSVDGLRQFRQSWTDSPLYATKNLERMRAFFRFCHQAGWISRTRRSR